MINKLRALPKPFFVLAPMDDVTDTVFRQIIAETAPPDLYFTEFVNVDGLQSPGRPRLIKKLQFSAQEKPLIAQVWGKKPDNYYKTVKELIDMGFDGVDINMGCPVKTVIKSGCCSALIDNRVLAGEIIDAAKEAAGDFPLSVKTRTGLDAVDLSWPEYLLGKKLDMLTIHGRTQKQLSKVPADWDVIGQIRELRDSLSPATLIVGNGDVTSRQHGLQLAEKHKLDGIMVGRGIFEDPFVFSKQSPWAGYSKKQKTDLYKKHISLYARTWGESGERRVASLNKFCKMYINGFDGAKELRERLMNAEDTDELLSILNRQD